MREMLMIIIVGASMGLAGCQTNTFDPARASRPYPFDLHRASSIDVQVFRDDTDIEIVNSSATTWRDADIWINQRYMHHIDELAAGETLRLSLWDFFDERGENFNAGGFFATYDATPVRLVQIQPGPGQPLVGLVAIREADEG